MLKEVQFGAGSNAGDTMSPNPKHLLELTTHNASKFKAVLESLRTVLTECSMSFSPEQGLRITAVDSKGICAAFMSLDHNYFDFYYCEEPLVIGVDVGLLHKLIKTPKFNDSQLSLIVRRDCREKLLVVIDNKTNKNRAKHELSLIHLEERYELKRSFDFPHVPAKVDSAYFQKLCRDFHSVGETEIAIRDHGDMLVFQGLKSYIRSEYEIGVFSVNELGEEAPAAQLETPMCGRFLLRYLLSFSKSASNLARRVRVLLAPEGFLLIEYILDPAEENPRHSLKYILFPIEASVADEDAASEQFDAYE